MRVCALACKQVVPIVRRPVDGPSRDVAVPPPGGERVSGRGWYAHIVMLGTSGLLVVSKQGARG